MDTLVTVVGRLERTVDGDVKVLRLLIGEGGEFDVELSKVGTSDFLIELLGEHVNTESELVGVGPESDLSEDLVGERAGHDEGGVTSSTTRGDPVLTAVTNTLVAKFTYPKLTRRPSARRMM